MSRLYKKLIAVILVFSILSLTAAYINAVKSPDIAAKTQGGQPEQMIGQLPSACTNPAPLKHIYDPSRLVVLNPCKTVSGTVLKVINETDGDAHIRLKVDSQYSDTINKANIDGNDTAIEIVCVFDHLGLSPAATAGLPCGNLVVEIVCASKTTKMSAMDACSGYDNKIKVPKVNDHIVVTGQFVSDSDHGGWNEIHPVYEIDVK